MQMLIWGSCHSFCTSIPSGSSAPAAPNSRGAAMGRHVPVEHRRIHFLSGRDVVGNLGQLASPLRPYEWAISLLAISAIRTLIGIVPVALLAIRYHYSVFEMGLLLIAFFVNLLIFGLRVGLAVSGLVLRCGLGAESLAWQSFSRSPAERYLLSNRDSSGLAAAGCPCVAVGPCV